MLEKLLKQKAEGTLVQFFRYLLVGGLAFAVDFGCLLALTELAGFHYLNSAIIAFTAGLISNYVLSISWVFNRRNYQDPLVEFLIFAGCGLIGLGLNQALLYLLTEKIGLHYAASKLVTTAIVLVWNFGSRKLLLFRRGSPAENLSRERSGLFDNRDVHAEPENLKEESCPPVSRT